jgi:predicted lipid-binding transport protein (Tim44 family)
MNKTTGFSILIFLSLTVGLLYFLHETAEASRMGRGGSFGSKRSYQRSAPAPAQNPAPSQAKQGQTAQQPVTAPSPMGRWGGMLGGLVMGSLIGSMLFGGGQGAGGPGLMDLLLIGGGCFLLFRFLRARRMAAQAPGQGGAMTFESNPSQGWGTIDYTPSEDATAAQQPALPPGFDADEFLKGANAVYVRLQASWAKRDLQDIRQFTSDEVFGEISRQAQEDPVPGKTELLMINSRVIEVRDVDNQRIVSVLYDVMMRENEDTLSKQVRELWHFSQEQDKPEAFWLLEGIQQVES